MSHVHQHDPVTASPVVKDPVCGMNVDPAVSEHHVVSVITNALRLRARRL